MANLADQVSVALQNAEFYRAAIVTSDRANALLNMMQSLTHDLGAQSFVLSALCSVKRMVSSMHSYASIWSIGERSGLVALSFL